MFCLYCGHENDNDASSCEQCGHVLHDDDKTTPVVTQLPDDNSETKQPAVSAESNNKQPKVTRGNMGFSKGPISEIPATGKNAVVSQENNFDQDALIEFQNGDNDDQESAIKDNHSSDNDSLPVPPTIPVIERPNAQVKNEGQRQEIEDAFASLSSRNNIDIISNATIPVLQKPTTIETRDEIVISNSNEDNNNIHNKKKIVAIAAIAVGVVIAIITVAALILSHSQETTNNENTISIDNIDVSVNSPSSKNCVDNIVNENTNSEQSTKESIDPIYAPYADTNGMPMLSAFAALESSDVAKLCEACGAGWDMEYNMFFSEFPDFAVTLTSTDGTNFDRDNWENIGDLTSNYSSYAYSIILQYDSLDTAIMEGGFSDSDRIAYSADNNAFFVVCNADSENKAAMFGQVINDHCTFTICNNEYIKQGGFEQEFPDSTGMNIDALWQYVSQDTNSYGWQVVQ